MCIIFRVYMSNQFIKISALIIQKNKNKHNTSTELFSLFSPLTFFRIINQGNQNLNRKNIRINNGDRNYLKENSDSNEEISGHMRAKKM